jgi:hypothetical protein
LKTDNFFKYYSAVATLLLIFFIVRLRTETSKHEADVMYWQRKIEDSNAELDIMRKASETALMRYDSLKLSYKRPYEKRYNYSDVDGSSIAVVFAKRVRSYPR